MRLLRRTIAAVALYAAFAAGCSLVANFSDLTGAADSSEAGADAIARDGTVDAIAITPRDGSGDVGIDALPCRPSLTLSTDGGLAQMSPFSTLGSYPNVESFFGDNAMVLFPFRDTSLVDAGPDASPEAGAMQKQQEFDDQHVGLWLPNPVAVTAFDVTFDAKIVCTSSSSCADGLIFAWLDMTSSSALNNGSSGDTAGLPLAVSGAGFDIDDYQNGSDEVSDPYAPSLQVISLDGTKRLDTYDWHAAITHATFLGDWHTYTVSLRGSTVTTTFDGASSLTAQVAPLTSAIVGFTAGVGGESDAVAIRNVSAQFYACTP